MSKKKTVIRDLSPIGRELSEDRLRFVTGGGTTCTWGTHKTAVPTYDTNSLDSVTDCDDEYGGGGGALQ